MQTVLERSRVRSRIRHVGGLVASLKQSLLRKQWAPRRRAVGHAHSKSLEKVKLSSPGKVTVHFSSVRKLLHFNGFCQRAFSDISFCPSCCAWTHPALCTNTPWWGGIEDIICKETQLYPSGCKYLDLAACTEFAVVVVWSRAHCRSSALSSSVAHPCLPYLVFLNSRRIAVVFKMGSVQSINVKEKHSTSTKLHTCATNYQL